MLSRETLESYRRMTLGQRLRLTLDLQQDSEKFLLIGTPEQVRRKFQLLERENNARNEGMLSAIAASKRRRNEIQNK